MVDFVCKMELSIVGKRKKNAGFLFGLLFVLKSHFFWAVNPLPNDKILDVTKLKAFSDDKLNTAKVMICLFDRVENNVGKGENAAYQHFLLFPQCFPMPSSLGSF